MHRMDTRMNTTPATVGVLGAGRHAQQGHIAPLLQIGAHVVVWDPDPQAIAAATSLGAHPQATQEAVLDTCDGVIVCSPDMFHTGTVAAATQLGLPVLVEKPAAVTRQDLDVLEPLLHDGTTVISTCHPRRMDPPFIAVKDTLTHRRVELGPVQTVTFTFDYPPPRPNQPQLHNSLLTDHFGHEFDTMEFLLGPAACTGVDELFGTSETAVTYAASGHRGDGVTFRFTGTRTNVNARAYTETMMLQTRNGGIHVDSTTGILTCTVGQNTTHVYVGPTNYEYRFHHVNEDFLRQVAAPHVSGGYVSKEQIWRNTLATVLLDEDGQFTLP